ncbi:hypothetical protein BKA56DRAFT_577624 [Ilyonectria sp. MPI-CAGE-AT-0026]|nr:hypothetical protein BKA56DRAFT_577624 [Ilyonectria sp. MPI-CAGE-AT-0026]
MPRLCQNQTLRCISFYHLPSSSPLSPIQLPTVSEQSISSSRPELPPTTQLYRAWVHHKQAENSPHSTEVLERMADRDSTSARLFPSPSLPASASLFSFYSSQPLFTCFWPIFPSKPPQQTTGLSSMTALLVMFTSLFFLTWAITGWLWLLGFDIRATEWQILDHEDRFSDDMLLLENKGEEHRNRFTRIFNPFLMARHKPVEVEHEPVGNEKKNMSITSI